MAPSRPSRLKDIALQANVSMSVVSRVLNDKAGVSEAARRAVLTAMDVLGYERPEVRGAHRTGLVGLLVPRLDEPTVPLLAQVISSELSRRGYTPVLCVQTQDGPDEDEHVAMLRERGVSGIVFVSGLHAEPDLKPTRYQALVAQRLPIVLVNGHLEAVDAPSISCDHKQAGTLAATHLRSLGHERIGLLTVRHRTSPVRAQRAGYRDVLVRHGCDDPSALETEALVDGIDGGYAGARRLLERGVTALIGESDLVALGAVQAVHQLGLSVPDDVSVVGYGDSLVMNHTGPPLTTVRQPVLAMGRAAAETLMDEIGGRRAPRGETLFRPELVIRSTTSHITDGPPARL